MKMRYFLLPVFSLLFAGNVRAQSKLVGSNCRVGNGPFISGDYTISTTPNIPITDDIQLGARGTAVFHIEGPAAVFTLSGAISGGQPDSDRVSMLIQGIYGTIVLAGTSPNTFTGMTELASGQLVLNKPPGVIAIPGSLSLNENNEHSVWCMADNQLNPGIPGTTEYKIIFRRATSNHRFNLFGTKQTIGGVVSENYSAVIQHGVNSNGFSGPATPAIIVNAWASRNTVPTLTLNGNFNYEYVGSPFLRAADSRQDLVINKTGTGTQSFEDIRTDNVSNKRIIFNVSAGTLAFQNPNPDPANTVNVSNVTFNSEPGATIEFRGTGGRNGALAEYYFGSGCIFKGAGIFKKTGEFSRLSLQANSWANLGNEVGITGTIIIEKGILQNVWCNVDWANSEADVTIRSGAAFDIWGNQLPTQTPFPTLFDELSGEGKIQNNMGYGAWPYESQLWIGVKNGSSTFAGTIVNNTGNNTPVVGDGGGTISLTKKGSGTQTLTGNNTYTGRTTISGGLLGGTGSILSSAVTVAPGGGLFGGTGTGTNGVFTTGNLTFTGTAANPNHVAVYANNSEATRANVLSQIQVGGATPGSRIGTGTLTADAGVTVNIDFMDPVTVADGNYTLISSRNTSALSGTFQVGINNSGCCLAILKNGAGIQVSVKKIILTPPVLGLCLAVAGVSKAANLNAACPVITTACPGIWSVVGSANNADGVATAGTATILGGTVTNGNNPATITSGAPGSVNAVFIIPASPDVGCTGKAIRRVDISTKPMVSGASTSCAGSTISLTGVVGPGATLTGADWNIYSTNTDSGISKQIPEGSISNGDPVSTGKITFRAKGSVYIRFSDSNQCPSEPFPVTINKVAPVLELLSGGIPGMPNTTCPTGTTAGNVQPVILAKYAEEKPTSTTGITWIFHPAQSPYGLQAPTTVTTDATANPTGVTGTYAIQCNTHSDFAYSTAYTVEYTDANACTSTINLTVTRQPLPYNNTTHLTEPTTICTGGTAGFSHTNADYPWTWHSDDPAIAKGDQEGITNSSISETVTGYRGGATTIYVTDAHGCNSEKLKVIVASPDITAPSPSVCTTIGGVAGSMELKTLNESPAGVDNPWTINPANDAATLTLNGLPADKKTIRLEVARTNLTAPVTVTVQYNTGLAGCTASKDITLNPSPVIDTGDPFAVCATVNGSPGTLSLGSSHEPGSMDNPWAINLANDAATLNGMAADKKTIRLTVANPNLSTPATVTVQYTGVSGCAGVKVITINRRPVIDLGAPFKVCANVNGSAGTLTFGSSHEPGTADNPWSFNPATADADLSNLSGDKKTITFTVHNKDQANVRLPVVQYVDVNGCAGTKVIVINPSPKLEVAAGIDLAALCSGATYSDLISLSGVGGTGIPSWKISDNTINTQLTGNNTLTAVSVRAGTTTQGAVTHSITFTSGYGCVSNILSVTVNSGVTISFAANGTNKICHPGTTMQLTAAGAASYTWSSGNEGVVTVDAQGLVKSLSVGTAIITAGVEGSNLCAGRQEVVVDDPLVGIATGFDASKLCADKDYTDVLTLTNGNDQGSWRVYEAADATAVTHTATAALWGTDRMSAVKKGSIHADNISGTVNLYVAFAQNNCESSRLLITIAAPPVMELVTNRIFCTGVASGEIALTSTATGDQAANVFKWAGGAEAGLADKTFWTASPIPSFTPINTTTSRAIRTVTVLPSNSRSTCVGTGTTFSISVEPTPVVTAPPAPPMCSGAETNFGLRPNVSGMLYTWTVTPHNTVGATNNEATAKNDINQTLTNRGTADASVTYTITPHTPGGCAGMPVTSVMVVKNRAAVSAAGTTGGGSFCLTPVANGTNGNPRFNAGGTYTTNIIPKISPPDPQVKWLAKSTHSANVSGIRDFGTTAQPLTTIQDHLVSTGSELETVTYSLTPYSGGCVGTETDVVLILKPTPEFTGNANSVPDISFCGGRKVHEDIDIRQVAYTGLTKPTGFTWVASANSEDTGLADYRDAARPRKKLGPFTLANTNANKHRSITLIPRNTDTGCAGLGQVVEIFLKAGPEISPVNPEICATDPNPLLLTTVNPGGATNDPNNPWNVLNGAEYGSVAYYYLDGTKGDFTPVNRAETATKNVKVQYTDSNGCTATVWVAVNYPPEIVSFTPATPPDLCAGETDDTAATTHIGISATKPGTKYTWSAARGEVRAIMGSVTVNGEALPTVISTVPKEEPLLEKIKAPAGSDADVVFSVTPLSGTCAGAVKTITVKVLGNGFATRVTPPANKICSGLTPDITVGSTNDGNTYTWTVDDYGGSVTGATAQTTGVSGGILINSVLSIPSGQTAKKAGLVKYFITGTHGNCQGIATEVTVEVNPNPAITGLSSGLSSSDICNNSPTGIVLANDIEASEANKVKYIWTVNANHLGATASTAPQSAFTEQTLTLTAPPNSITSQPLTGGAETEAVTVTYTFTAAYGTCAGTATDIVRTLTFPITMNTISGEGKACLGDEVTLTSNAKGGDLTYKWWKNSDATPIDGATDHSYTVSSGAESNDSYHVSVSNPCQSEAVAPQVSVQVTKDGFFEGATVAAAYPPEGVTLNQDWVNFTYTPAHAEDAALTVYVWDFGDKTSLVGSQNPRHLYASGSGSVTPVLTVKKTGQEACTKTWSLPPIVLLDSKSDSGTGAPNSTELQVSPVPARDRITITNGNEMSRITISALNGKQVLSTPVTGNQVVVPVSGLSSGLYILTVETAHGLKYVKIIKE